MGNIVKTAKCRFCGQMTQIEADEELTAAQATFSSEQRWNIVKMVNSNIDIQEWDFDFGCME